MRARSGAVPTLTILVVVGSISVVAGVVLSTIIRVGDSWDQIQLTSIIALGSLCGGLILAKALVPTAVLFAVLHGIHLLILISIVRLVAPTGTQYQVLIAVFLIEGCVYLPIRIAAAVSIGLALVLSLSPGLPDDLPSDLIQRATDGVLYVAIAAIGTAMIRFRERYVVAQTEVRRLDNTVTQLTRASLSYQEYAQTAAERSQEHERQRITRDIHDIVGYTLTNNIMMMEAATDMMRRNPRGVASLISTARENAQDGLSQIRKSLYQLREGEVAAPIGLAAIQRLVRIFREATDINVKVDYSNMPIELPSETDSVLYHCVQEGLINSFRHGHASSIDVNLSQTENEFRLTIRDDGVGSSSGPEGIGMRGMKERAADVGGRVTYLSTAHGFTVSLSIPVAAGSASTIQEAALRGPETIPKRQNSGSDNGHPFG